MASTKESRAFAQSSNLWLKKKVWWQRGRDESHQWQATIKDRTAGGGCPSCMVKGTSGYGQEPPLSSDPELASEWHRTLRTGGHGRRGRKATRYEQQGLRLPVDERPKRNRRLRPSDVSIGSTEYVWWQCKKNHVWYAMISTRTYMKAGCPVCSGLKVSSETSLLAKYPGVSKQWHPTRNLPLEPGQVSAGSGKKVWWRCFKSADHVWQAEVRKVVVSWKNRSSSNGCPFCAGKRALTIA